MSHIARPDAGYVAIVTVRVDGPQTQRRLVEMLSKDVEDWVRHCPGFLSANYHTSVDGTQMVNYAQWTSEAAYRASFDQNPDKERMREAIRSLPGVLEGPSMTAFALDRSIEAP
jgi:C-6 monooxygenase